jgi:hypothetical protein
MTKFIRRGDQYRLIGDENLIVDDSLPVGTYTIDLDTFNNEFYLKRIDPYTIVGKLYGETEVVANRIMTTYCSRASSTGVLLSGEKGTGKTLLAKLLSVKGQAKGIPTIVINNGEYHGEVFNRFIQSINQLCIIIFDEFEKMYRDVAAQESMLTLLDGVYPTQKLFILTTNDRYGISRHMLNRPGRLFYHLEYRGLDDKFVQEYSLDNLIDTTQVDGVIEVSTLFQDFNFDMLKALIEEMNRYNESAKIAMKMMNIKVESYPGDYEASATIRGRKIENEDRDLLTVDPLKKFHYYYYETPAAKKKGDSSMVTLGIEYLTTINRGVYVYHKGDLVVTLTKVTQGNKIFGL